MAAVSASSQNESVLIGVFGARLELFLRFFIVIVRRVISSTTRHAMHPYGTERFSARCIHSSKLTASLGFTTGSESALLYVLHTHTHTIDRVLKVLLFLKIDPVVSVCMSCRHVH